MKSKEQPIYNNLQRILCLSYLSNISGFTSGSREAILAFTKKAIEGLLSWEKMLPLIGNWTVVWGPCIFQEEKTIDQKAGNTMYVAENLDLQGHPQYVIAIAGSMSIYDYFIEDFRMWSTSAWKSDKANSLGLSPRISTGTKTGLNILLDGELNKEMEDDGQDIINFLKITMKQQKDRVEIIITGHSLGGALSTALALHISEKQDDWDPERRAVLTAFPSAGPPIGNIDFSVYYDTQLGGRITRIWNSLDFVPHLWSNLDTALCLYCPDFPPGTLVQIAVNRLKLMTGTNVYSQIMPQTPGLPGRVVDLSSAGVEKPDPASLGEENANLFNFLAQVFYQHVLAYPSQLGLFSFVELLRKKNLWFSEVPSVKDEKFSALCNKLEAYKETVGKVIKTKNG